MPRPAGRSKTRGKAIRVVVVDDHPLWRETLRQVLENAGYALVGTASDGEQAVAVARSTRPDIVVMDVNLPGMDGVSATEQLVAENPDTRVLALSSSDEPSSVIGIVRAGASGYLVKTAGGEEVAQAVRRVHAGELVFPPALADLVLHELRRTPAHEEESPIRVVLADEAVLLREGLARLLSEAGLEIVGQADDAVGLEDLMVAAEPAVAVVDVKLASRRSADGKRLLHSLRERHPATGILVLSAEVQAAQALKLMGGSAAGLGYLLKERVSKVEDLVDAIRHLRGGEPVVDREVVDRLVAGPRERSILAGLTERECEVLKLMAEGRSNQAICERLFLSSKGVESHVRSIFTKLGLEPAPDDHRRVLAVLTFLKA